MADSDETKPYLPERYRQKIREKNRRRTVVRILTVALILGVVVILLLSLSQLSWAGLPAASSPPPQAGATVPVTTSVSMHPTSAVTALPDAGFFIEAGVPQQEGGGTRSLAQAETALRGYCPEDMFTIRSVN
jgi:predicted anti-sigma-YlaC factor YlaD